MGWELVKDGEKVKCWLNLDEIGKTYKGYDWKNSVGKKIGVRYQWKSELMEEKWFIIINYLGKNITIIDSDSNNYNIGTANLFKGNFGKMFGKVTNEFKHNIGDTFNNLIIINKEYRKNKRGQNCKYYQYQCNKCDNIDWITEDQLKKGTSCNVCFNKKILKGVNDIATTHPHLVKYFVNQEDIYRYSYGSDKKVLLRCPDCKSYERNATIQSFVSHGFVCPICSGISYPEKFMANFLKQLELKFICQLSVKDFNWCKTFLYDFYLLDYNIIIETHGKQHYEDGFYRTYEETHENDMVKYDIAVLNGFEYNKNYFVIDSRNSTLEWMKKNIIETLGHLFDLSNIDWQKADLESQKSHMLLVCQLKKENEDLTTKEIIKIIEEETGIKYCNGTIQKWLNNGTEKGLCFYNGKEEHFKGMKKYGDILKPHMLLICQLKNENPNLTVTEISNLFKQKTNKKISNDAVRTALKKGTEKGLCFYDSKEERKRINQKQKNKPKKGNRLVSRFDENMRFLDVHFPFEYEKFGYSKGNISTCCIWYNCGKDLKEWNKNRKDKPRDFVSLDGKKYIFKYATDDDINTYIIKNMQVKINE